MSLSLREFLDALDTKVFSFWSFQRSEIRPDCKLYSKEPAITTQDYIRAFHWINLNLKIENIQLRMRYTTLFSVLPTQLPSTQLHKTNRKKGVANPKPQQKQLLQFLLCQQLLNFQPHSPKLNASSFFLC